MKSVPINLYTGINKVRQMLGFDVYNQYPYWINQFYENDEYAVACEMIATMLGASSWKWVAQNKNDNRQSTWDEWRVKAKLDTVMHTLNMNKFGLGNAQAVVAAGLPKLKQPDTVLQVMSPNLVYPIWHETGEIEAWKVYADRVKTGKVLAVVHANNMLHTPNTLFMNNKLGLALGQQLYLRLERKRRVEAVCSIIGENMAAPTTHVKVDLSELDYDVPEDAPEGTISEAQAKVNEAAEAFQARVNSKDGIIYNVVVTDNIIEADVLDPKVDLDSVVKFLEHDQMLIDSALMVPPVFKGRPDSSNRATSFTELVAFAVWLKQHWMRTVQELEAKVLPEILQTPNIPPGKFEYDPIIKEDEIKRLLAAADAYQKGLWEARQEALNWANATGGSSQQQ